MLEAMQTPLQNTLLPWSRCLSVLILATSATGLQADDWMTWASTYTHSPQTGQRVDQYAQVEQPISPYRQDFTRSGYRHFRSTLQGGQSADNMHIVEQWGQPVIPYEQWRFPFRPYAVPYDAWGPQAPYGITNGLFQFGVGGGNWGGHTGGYNPPQPGNGAGYGAGYGGGRYDRPGQPDSRGFPLTPTYNNEPWYDGSYPTVPPLRER